MSHGQWLATQLPTTHPERRSVDFLDVLDNVGQVLLDHASFLAYYKQIDTDFIYDRTSGLYLVGITGAHVDLMAALLNYYAPNVESDRYKAADLYILKSYGMFKSRAGHRIYHGPNFIVPLELRSIARDLEIL